MVQPLPRERESIHRQCGRALSLRRVGQRTRHVERKAVDAEARCFGGKRRIRFNVWYFRQNGRGTHGRVALLCVPLLLRLPILFGVRPRGSRLVGRGRCLLCISCQWHEGGNR
ncbi:hypothetical protein BOC48_04485 [Burkholderia pseudomallei]|nr:hypothetical protein BOC47_08615 [Burkholderia pseudomallei]ARL31626.1 hypothetical protein BOC48_04485 [Burkholderia pseudomallei]ARL74750.1 hypothetical protein BOC54_11835 [Burkholderia pseudomallei]